MHVTWRNLSTKVILQDVAKLKGKSEQSKESLDIESLKTQIQMIDEFFFKILAKLEQETLIPSQFMLLMFIEFFC